MSEFISPRSIHIIAEREMELPSLLVALERTAQIISDEVGQQMEFNWSSGRVISPIPTPSPDLVILSMLHEMLPPYAPMSLVAERWHALLERLRNAEIQLLLCNVFRHIGPESLSPDFLPAPALRERARRLNLLAIGLSHQYGADLADIDARLAALGARLIKDDFRLEHLGRVAAADAIVWSLLQTNLFGNAGARAAVRHGGIAGIHARILGSRGIAEQT